MFDKILSTGNIHSWSDSPFYYTTEDTREKVIKNISKYSKYNKDWNWLTAIEKIESLKNNLKMRQEKNLHNFKKYFLYQYTQKLK